MPSEISTLIPRGEGSVSSQWSPPQVSVATPGLQQQQQPSQFDNLFNAVLSVGQGAANALGAAASAKNHLENLKERSIAKMDRDLALASRSFHMKRLDETEKQFLALQIEAEEKGPAWLALEAKTRYDNSHSSDEQKMWAHMYLAASNAAKQEMARAEHDAQTKISQEYSRAAKTAHNIITQIAQEIELNPELQQELIGDGKNIHQRVQDYALSRITLASPESFIIGNNDPNASFKREQRDMLTSAIVGQSMSIANELIHRVAKEKFSALALNGHQQLDNDNFAFLTGKKDDRQHALSASEIMDTRFVNLTEAEKVSAVKDSYLRSLTALSNGEYGVPTVEMKNRAIAMLSRKVNGVPVFSEGEKQSIISRLSDNFRKTVLSEHESRIARLIQESTIAVPDAEGHLTYKPDPMALVKLSQEMNNGISRVTLETNKLLAEMGLLDKDPSELTADEALIVGDLRRAEFSIRSEAIRQQVRFNEQRANYAAVQSGQPGGNINDAYEFSSLTKIVRGQALTAEEINFNKDRVYETLRERHGKIPMTSFPWDGQSIPERTPETRQLREAIFRTMGKEFSNGSQISRYGVPTEMVRDVTALFTSENIEEFHDGLAVLQGLRSEGAINTFLSKIPEDDSAVGSAMRMALAESKGQQSGEHRMTLEQIADMVRATIRNGPTSKWLGEASPWAAIPNKGELPETNISALNRAFLTLIAEKTGRPIRQLPKTIIDPETKKIIETIPGEEIQPDNYAATPLGISGPALENLFADRSDIVDALRTTAFVIHKNNPRMSINEVAARAWHQFNSGPQRIEMFYDPNGHNMIGLRNHQNHLPPSGSNLKTWVTDSTTKQFNAQTRSVLMDAMGYQGFETPNNMAEVFIREYGNPGQPLHGLKPTDLEWTYNPSLNQGGMDTLVRSPAELGGLTVTVLHPRTGEALPVPRTRKAIVVTDAEGRQVVLPAGTPIGLSNHYF